MSIDHIDHGLWIADIDSVREHSTNRFDLVVSVCQDACPQNVADETPYEHYPLADDAISEEKWGGSTDYALFSEAAESVRRTLNDDKIEDILVHCHVGRNRSASICAAAIAVYEGTVYGGALAKIRNARPIVNPNDVMKFHAKRFIEKQT